MGCVLLDESPAVTQGAIEDFDTMLAADPGNPQATASRGGCKFCIGDFQVLRCLLLGAYHRCHP